jgi:predicted O-methyltransferase YrrM
MGKSRVSAQIDYLETCIEKTQQSEALIFECGSGLSTILLGFIAKKQNRKMVSFEHIASWAKRVQKEIDRNQLINNEIILRSLKDYGTFSWYNIDGIELEKIGLCICDAPPGDTKGGRRGFFNLYQNHLLPNSIILVDDVIRDDEKKMIHEWGKVKPMSIEFCGDFDPHALLSIH